MEDNLSEEMIKEMPIGWALHQVVKDKDGKPYDYIFVDANLAFEELTGLSSVDIIGKKATEVMPSALADSFDWIKTYAKVVSSSQKNKLVQDFYLLGKWYEVSSFSPRDEYFATIFEDVSEKKILNSIIQRQNAIIKIYSCVYTNEQEFLDQILHIALQLTDSQFGYIYLYDEKTHEFELNTWTNGVMENCKIMDKKTVYQLKNTGIWGEVVRQRKPIIVNDFSEPHPLKKGYPKGHVSLFNYMSIPVFDNDVIVAVIGISNSPNCYTEADINELRILMESAWLIKRTKKLEQDEKLQLTKQNTIYNQIPALICEYDKESRLMYVNDRYCEFFNLKKEELIGKLFLDFIPDEDREAAKQKYLNLTFENPVCTYEHRVIKEDEVLWTEWRDTAIFDEKGNVISYCSIGYDITERKSKEEIEKKELDKLSLIFYNHPAIMLFIEADTGRIIDANPSAIDFYGYSKNELVNKNIQDINMLSEEKVKELRSKAADNSQNCFTVPHKIKNDDVRIVDVYSSPVKYYKKDVLLSIIFDVTEKDKANEEIKFLAYRDHLTEVYNRRYFEEVFYRINKEKNQSLAIIMADINGLKLVNENYGNATGDQLIKTTAQEILAIIRKEDILARIGGDEFAILLKNASQVDVVKLINRMEENFENYIIILNDKETQINLSVSFGWSIQRPGHMELPTLIKEAESHVYRRKIYNENSSRSHMIRAIMSTLFQKSEREQTHSKRVSILCKAIAESIGWDFYRINRLGVAGSLHDIGKIGIDERILNKKGKLDENEWESMKLHPLKSALILEETEEYLDLADIVKSHHERWDGKGYPEGLKGEEIPEESRVIAVADSYDAMTSERTYRKPMSREEAILELIRCRGTQFDPRVVDLFVEQVLSR